MVLAIIIVARRPSSRKPKGLLNCTLEVTVVLPLVLSFPALIRRRSSPRGAVRRVSLDRHALVLRILALIFRCPFLLSSHFTAVTVLIAIARLVVLLGCVIGVLELTSIIVALLLAKFPVADFMPR